MGIIVNKFIRVKGWITYFALVAAVFVVHACAAELDSQADAPASARHA
jgi:hypothetical protein